MHWLEPHWAAITPVSVLLYPLGLAFGIAAAARRGTYRLGLARAARLPVPVIVVGNITAGGTGKTPLTLWLAGHLRARGRTPGIVCRGYGGSERGPLRVLADSDPRACGEEAVLLARRSGCQVWAGVDRAAAARALLAAQPACDVIVSDDGLQHYALARDAELCVVDGARRFGNGWLLPAGPLREPPARLATVDAVVLNDDATAIGDPRILEWNATCFAMRLEARGFHNLLEPGQRVSAEHFRGRRVHAVAGIGNPLRFFRQLRAMGLDVVPHPFPDHHPFRAPEIAFGPGETVVMTEKDAVKCREFAAPDHWFLAVDAVPDVRLGELLARKLGMAEGRA